jgi:thiol:disulfide interchange protein
MIAKDPRAALVLLVALAITPAFAQQQFHPRHIYDETADAHAEVRDALAIAARQHKRVILDFGGNWCGDCQVLDFYFHQQPNDALLNASYVLVDVDIGHYDHNTDLATQYDVPLKRGVPALAVLDSHGRLLYSQKTGEFENMRNMNPTSVTTFLQQWKPDTSEHKGGQ